MDAFHYTKFTSQLFDFSIGRPPGEVCHVHGRVFFFFVKMKMIDLEEIRILVVVSSPNEVGKSFKIVKK